MGALARGAARGKAKKIRRKGGAGWGKFTGFLWRNKTGKRGLHKSGPVRLRLYAPGETGDRISNESPKKITMALCLKPCTLLLLVRID
jgi:hypothetical protein